MSGAPSVPGEAGFPAREEKQPPRLVTGLRRRLLAKEIKTLLGPASARLGEDELVVLCLVRDGRAYVEEFVRHYRSLGAAHLVFLDNGSTDGTVEALESLVAGEGDMTVLRSKLPYREYKYLMKQYLHERFGTGRWSLYADIDEFFDYPYSDTLGVRDLLGYLTQNGYTAVTCHMLDMFPRRLVAGDTSHPDGDFRDHHRLYDLTKLGRAKPGALRGWGNEVSNPLVERFSGGIRETLFDVRPNLTKYPLVFLDGEVVPAFGSSHRVAGAKIADISCVLYHYKFLQGFHDQARKAVREGNYYAGSKEYRKYLEVLDSGPELVFEQETSSYLKGTDDLIRANFIIASEPYVALADRLSGPEEDRGEERAAHLRGHRQFARDLAAKREEVERRREARERKRRSKPPRPGEALRSLGASGPDELPDRVRPLFVGGCQRSGTTAFVEYLNDLPEIVVCYERYKTIPEAEVTPEKFTFERILDYRSGETRKPWNLEVYIERHRRMLETKRAGDLRWIGDKNPNFVAHIPVLLKNNPGARFIMLYRPVEEVAESWQSRAEDATDQWSPADGFEKGVSYWNRAMRALREFAEGKTGDRLLILEYRNFFESPGECVPLLSRFLGVEFSGGTLRAWRERSAAFGSERREKSPLTREQTAYIEAHADRESEGYVRSRMLAQKSDPSNPVYAEGDDPAATAEARALAALRRYGRLLEVAEGRINHYAARSENLELQLQAMRSSRSWRAVLFLGGLKNRVAAASKRLRG